MAFRLDKLVPCGSLGDRLIWYYQNLEDPAPIIRRAGYFPKSLEVEKVVAAARGVQLICRTELSLVRKVSATIDHISDKIVEEGMGTPVASKGNPDE